MFARLDDLPAVPARDGAISPLTPGGISGPIYGAKEFPVAGGRVRAMLFRVGALIGVALAEIAGIGADRGRVAKVPDETYAATPSALRIDVWKWTSDGSLRP